MPHANGKIYSEVVNGVKKGINTDDVKAVLGESSHEVKTLCISKKINPAAIFRPRYMGGAPHVAPEDFQSKLKELGAPPSGVQGVTMKCVDYGIWVPYFNSIVNGYPYFASRVRWNPRPCDETQFGDLTHFDGYNHNARFTNPVSSVICAIGSPIKVTFRASSSTDNTIGVGSLFGDNENAYFGFFVYEYQGEGFILSGSGALLPKVFINSYYIPQNSAFPTVTSNVIAKNGYNYDIIPIVAVNNNGDWEYYSLFISDSVPGLITKRVGSDDIEFIYFRFSEGGFYPDGDVIETGTSIGVANSTFGFALMMSSPFPKILATTDMDYASGLIRPSTIKITARFTRWNDKKLFTKDFTEANGGLTVLRQLNTNILRMYVPIENYENKVFTWARSVAGTLAGDFDFDIAFTINVNKTGGSEKCSFPGQSWMGVAV